MKWDATNSKWLFDAESSPLAGYVFTTDSSTESTLVIKAASTDALEQAKKLRDLKSATAYIRVSDGATPKSGIVNLVSPDVKVGVDGFDTIYTSDPGLRATSDDFTIQYKFKNEADSAYSDARLWCLEGDEYNFKLISNSSRNGVNYLNSYHYVVGMKEALEDDVPHNVWKDTIDSVTSFTNPTLTYKYNDAGTIGLTKAFDKDIIINGPSDPRSITLGGTGWDNYSTSNKSEVKLTGETGFSPSKDTLASSDTFTVTPIAAKGYTLTAKVYDTVISPDKPQNTKTFTFNVVEGPSISFDETEYEIEKGDNEYAVVYCGNKVVTDNCTLSSTKSTVATISSDGEITGRSVGNATITAVYSGWASCYEGKTTGFSNPNATAIVIVTSGSTGGDLKFKDDVYIYEGCSVNLMDFMKYDDKEMDVVVDFDGGIAKIGSKSDGKKSDNPGALNQMMIYGAKVGSKTDGITVWPDGDPDASVSRLVKVYPAPSISIGSSGGFGSFNSSSSSSNAGIKITVPAATYHGRESEWNSKVEYAFVTFGSLSSGKSTTVYGSVSGSGDTKTATISLATVSNEISKIAKGDSDQILVEVNPNVNGDITKPDKVVSGGGILLAYKIELKGDSATYKVNGESVKDYFYAIADQEYTIESVAKNSGDKFQKWEGDESSTAKIDKIKFSSPRTLHAVYGNSSSSSSSSSSSKLTANGTGTGADSEGLDDVPKTGESKTDIWILWTVLLVSILGAGFMIYRRFGVVNAIAQAQADETAAIEQEKIDAEVKEKEDKLRVLKNLRNLK